ncbi:MAG: N-acetylmuramic acid 6-phosphate etherase [Clostridiales bacterium GWF2_36_10]|nr:MAG: N-acetylmuramic acid 6-phosphate etherase [Clostridiales bacterium GWF2_36_10]HAN21750.1 N-acetylmuramic acid 6-phosphate etherase [Clostridiales bacterium]
MTNFNNLQTESINKNTANIDKMSAIEIVKCINDEDKTVAFAVEKALPEIAVCVDILADALKNSGRIFYVGAGTSGRLGVLDASECPPTFGVSSDVVQGVLAGGPTAAYNSIEDAEDDFESIVKQLKEKNFYGKDVLIAISASGSANCVKGAINYAKQLGCQTMCVSCNKNSDLISMCENAIIAEVGPEVINGSTRMKAGTAQKMILNMLSTGAMIRFGRVRGNYMAYMIPSNIKLVDRAIRIIMAKTGVSYEKAEFELDIANNVIADAIDNIENI